MTDEILVVDDEESIRFTFRNFLSKEGYNVVTAENVPSALAILAEGAPDLVFADILLADGSGTDVLKAVKDRGYNCPVIMITGQPDIDTAAASVRLGAYDYLPKPVRKETLLRIAAMALQHKGLLDAKDRAEQERHRYQSYLEAVFRSVRDAIVTVDTARRITGANPAVHAVLGLSEKDIENRRFDDIDHPAAPHCLRIMEDTLDSGNTTGEITVECRIADSRHLVLGITASPMLDTSGQPMGAVLILRDLTRLNALEKELNDRQRYHGIIGKSQPMQAVYRLLESLAETDTTVLITGESGTGKELIAKALHANGPRAGRPMISVNCTALPEPLLESELFGHVQGAFTNAIRDKKGRFELADGGTLFLDEIGEISQILQVKLLRVLQEKSFERVGDSKTRSVDVRIIAATNRNLKEKMETGTFRKDLYYRLKVIEIELPPLRRRPEDIPLLAEHFRRRFAARFKKEIHDISGPAMDLLLRYPWPGNIRELEHAVEHAFVLCGDTIISAEHLPREIRDAVAPDGPAGASDAQAPGGVTPEAIQKALDKTGGNKAKAARLLGVSRQTLYRKLANFEIDPSED